MNVQSTEHGVRKAGRRILFFRRLPGALAALVLVAALAVHPGMSIAGSPPSFTDFSSLLPQNSLLQAAQNNSGFSVADVSGVTGEPLRLAIFLPQEAARPSSSYADSMFLMFKGLPEGFRLSAGFRINGVWAVSLKDVPDLALIAPADYSGAFAVMATLHKGKEAPLMSHRFSVRLERASAAEAARSRPTAAVSETAPAARARPVRKPEDAAMLRKAETLFQNGDLEAARLIYRQLAEHNDSEAALKMAETFDPEVLKKLQLVGIRPSAEKAQEWYKRARELGEAEAQERLDLLSREASR